MKNKIFNIKTEDDFQATCLEIFSFQYDHCEIYRKYVDLIKVKKSDVKSIDKIPFLPISFFKTQIVVTTIENSYNPEIIFSSSATTGVTQAKHHVLDLAIYERSFREGFKMFYGEPEEYAILALLPSYLEREGSSLVYMVDSLIKASKNPHSGYFLYDHEDLYQAIVNLEKTGQKVLLIGVTFALLDFAEKHSLPSSDNVKRIIIETGGMKGRGTEIPREELHKILSKSFCEEKIHSEYGMCELLSQAYSIGDGLFSCPPWMKIYIRDINNPFAQVPKGNRGAINIIDLANLNSCAFIETEDIGRLHENGMFSVEGRLANVEIRGCNMLVE